MHKLTQNRLRILDALVAEHVMGFKWFSALGEAYLIPPFGQEYCRKFHVHWTEGLREEQSNGKVITCKKRYNIELRYSRDYSHFAIPHYSTVREDAFSVMEHLGKTQHVHFWQRHDPEYQGLWFVHNDGARVHGLAETLPQAAVLFALKLNNIALPWKFKQKPRPKVASPTASAS